MSRNPFLQKLERAGRLTDEEQTALQALTLGAHALPPRHDLAAGEAADRVHLVMSGYACRYKTLETGSRRIVSFVLPGDLCTLHDAGPFGRDLQASTLTRCTVVEIPRHKLVALIASYPGIGRALWWVTLRELSRAREWIVNGVRSADKRLAHLFCELLTCLQVIDLADGNGFAFPVSQADLADAVGISPVHLNRVLQALRGEGLLSWSNQRLIIPDVDHLKAFAEFDPAYLCFDGFEHRAAIDRVQPAPERRVRLAAG
ncbi:Crp/Fnr family transcriptional regulator [Methylobacterium oxalidis]|uniref:Transcriptional regulator n=1 Tax=Methylobacterium oxalidis TaxID=944322 RepID=A0A512IZJ6_9HYPH|nr:Crp/Fnr family transcriptional regulator [Methylobacterium oxalidis]GEP03039.1 transcriptional regulator [Methylobacterium oxalidis]GJE31683.1 hypothetical protein LDDCCGHA_1863 [Methylobacterium oxalidis]GLS65972.1 transcriptional regulator [Methylobacterium oxalidis]